MSGADPSRSSEVPVKSSLKMVSAWMQPAEIERLRLKEKLRKILETLECFDFFIRLFTKSRRLRFIWLKEEVTLRRSGIYLRRRLTNPNALRARSVREEGSGMVVREKEVTVPSTVLPARARPTELIVSSSKISVERTSV